MAFVKVAALSKFPPGSLCEVVVEETPIALCNVAGDVRAIGGQCPHSNGPLGYGALHQGSIVCPWHAWEFDSSTGCNDFRPDICVAVYPVRIDGDDILVDPGA
jgi:nitrite reductase/ring-hydroxylating ferredoxin subunit